jgi:hypothetical protein
MSKFWLDDPSILYTDYKQIIPHKNMTRNEQLNAITRLCLLLLLFFCIAGFDVKYHIVIIAIILIILIVGRTYSGEQFYTKNTDVYYEGKPEYELEASHYDSDNNLIVGKEFTANTNPENKLACVVGDLNPICKEPTADNPFMNPNITEFNTENPPSACNTEDDKIRSQIDKSFNENLYVNLDDLFNVKNSQRQFYTIPVPAIPPDQTAFANWAYKPTTTCKENQGYCLRYEDLRLNR